MDEDVCTAETYSSADNATCESFGSAPASGKPVGCSALPPKTVPCDIEDVVLNSIAATRQKEYRREDGQWTAQPIQPGKRAISLQGTDPSAPKQSQIQVVGERMGTVAVTRIRTYVYPLASHGGDHIKVTVNRSGEPDIVKSCPAQDTLDFSVYRTQPVSILGGIFERYFTLGLPPAQYVVTAESCGVRNSGTPVGAGVLQVLVYPYDQYTLTLSVPPLAKRSYSRSLVATDTGTSDTVVRDRAGGVSTTESTQTQYDPSGLYVDSTTRSRETTAAGWAVSHSTQTETLDDGSTLTISVADSRQAAPAGPSLELKKNGAADDVSASLSSLIETLQSVESAVQAIRDLVKSWVPQVGFKFDVGVSFLSGSLWMSWGWKEFSDYRVYFGFTAGYSLSLFSVTLSVSLGLSIGPATARVVGEIPDAGISVNGSWEFNRPGNFILPPTATAKGTLPVEVRGEAIIDLHFVRASAAAGIKSGFTVEGGTRLTDSNGFEMYASIVWTGLSAFVQTQSPGQGVEEHNYPLIDSHDIWKGKVPI